MTTVRLSLIDVRKRLILCLKLDQRLEREILLQLNKSIKPNKKELCRGDTDCTFECNFEFSECYNYCPCLNQCPEGCLNCPTARCQCRDPLSNTDYLTCEERVYLLKKSLISA